MYVIFICLQKYDDHTKKLIIKENKPVEEVNISLSEGPISLVYKVYREFRRERVFHEVITNNGVIMNEYIINM